MIPAIRSLMELAPARGSSVRQPQRKLLIRKTLVPHFPAQQGYWKINLISIKKTVVPTIYAAAEFSQDAKAPCLSNR